MSKKVEDPCVICWQSIKANSANPTFWTKGNNALPVAEGLCCDDCNNDVVTLRLTRLLIKRSREEKR